MVRIKCVNTGCTGPGKVFEWDESRYLKRGGGIAAPRALDGDSQRFAIGSRDAILDDDQVDRHPGFKPSELGDHAPQRARHVPPQGTVAGQKAEPWPARAGPEEPPEGCQCSPAQ